MRAGRRRVRLAGVAERSLTIIAIGLRPALLAEIWCTVGSSWLGDVVAVLKAACLAPGPRSRSRCLTSYRRTR